MGSMEPQARRQPRIPKIRRHRSPPRAPPPRLRSPASGQACSTQSAACHAARDADGVSALFSAHWPALTELRVRLEYGEWDEVDGALDASAFAGLFRLETLCMSSSMSGAVVRALARQMRPALKRLELVGRRSDEPPTLEAVRRWAPAIEKVVWRAGYR